MSYSIEGGGSNTLSKAKKWLYQDPQASHRLLRMLTDVVSEYLVGQVKAGAQMLQVFESNAEHLTAELFNDFCMPCLKEIATRVRRDLEAEGIEPVPMVN